MGLWVLHQQNKKRLSGWLYTHSTWLHAAVQSLAVEGPWLALCCPMGLLTL